MVACVRSHLVCKLRTMRKRHLPSTELNFVTMCGHETTEQEFLMIKGTKEVRLNKHKTRRCSMVVRKYDEGSVSFK